MAKRKVAHVEVSLFECAVGPANCGDDISMFRCPTSGSGLPEQVGWDDIQAGDCIIAVGLDAKPRAGGRLMYAMQFWDVVQRNDDDKSFTVYVNNIVGSGGGAEEAIDRVKGLLGRVD